MSFNHSVICTYGSNDKKTIILSKAERILYDYSVQQLSGYYDDETVDLFNYIINTYIISTEKVSKWLMGDTQLDDFDYLDDPDTGLKNHKLLLKVLQLCNGLKCDIGSDIISKLISTSILKTPISNVSDLVNFEDK